MRRSLRRLLDGTPGFEVVAEAADLALTGQHVAGHHPDVLVIDLNMPDGSSPEALEELCERMPGLRVVVTSDDDAPGFAQRAFAAGANGYVLKERADTELPDAVNAAFRDERYVGPIVGSRLGEIGRASSERMRGHGPVSS